ncbi:hypothetical protein K443DRAFT_671207 [Laccaria amethystina LaAM-08-1]|uniref:Uncharacterized protein n=1 Tax=Laccaria amethystina LaAM-08-1 TaxID=1095629 RepID=A0A0C9XCB6_9AGAR|nr:hypothetical protein K443DRAFT_671207 [Laccaria amethystina LaAM-08-1]
MFISTAAVSQLAVSEMSHSYKFKLLITTIFPAIYQLRALKFMRGRVRWPLGVLVCTCVFVATRAESVTTSA